MEDTFRIVLIIILSYLAGSVPSALIVSKAFFGFDIREKGSGNMGSTNAFRVLGWKWGIVVQIADILKGAAAVLLIAPAIGSGIEMQGLLSEPLMLQFIAGVSAVCGHIWTVFAGFKGGKGINTAAGMLIGIVPVDAVIALSIFVLVVVFSGYISLGSMAASVAVPSSLFLRYNFFGVMIPDYDVLIYFFLALSALLIFTHRSNVGRLIKGEENKFSKLQLIKLKLKK